MNFSRTGHELVLNRSCIDHESVMNWSWTDLDHELIVIWFWTDHETIMNCSWIGHELVMNWSCFDRELIMNCHRMNHDLVMNWSELIMKLIMNGSCVGHECIMDRPWTDHVGSHCSNRRKIWQGVTAISPLVNPGLAVPKVPWMNSMSMLLPWWMPCPCWNNGWQPPLSIPVLIGCCRDRISINPLSGQAENSSAWDAHWCRSRSHPNFRKSAVGSSHAVPRVASHKSHGHANAFIQRFHFVCHKTPVPTSLWQLLLIPLSARFSNALGRMPWVYMWLVGMIPHPWTGSLSG